MDLGWRVEDLKEEDRGEGLGKVVFAAAAAIVDEMLVATIFLVFMASERGKKSAPGIPF